MCHKCINKRILILIAILNNYKTDKEPLALVGALTLLNGLQEKMLEMVLRETLLRDSYIELVDIELLDRLTDLLEEVDINKEVLNHHIMDIYNDLR